MTVGIVSGLIVGLVVWSIQLQRFRRELFSRSRLRRVAALGYLAGRPGVETARLLADYVRWETHPALRRRGEELLRRMQVHFE